MPNQGITDIDSLCLQVRDRESRRLISEAIAAYRGGALRSAIMSTWIAVAYDIISKARELASQGDPAAQTLVNAIENAIANKNVRKLQDIENALLETAESQLQFLARHETDTLRRLYDDRHLCAHPAFVAEDQLFQPSLELSRSHIVHALKTLLVHAPIQGKSAINRFEADLLNPSFPVLPDAVDAYMRSKYLNRAKDELIKNLIKRVLTLPFFAERARFSGKERQLTFVLASIASAKTTIYEDTVPSFIQSIDRVGDDVLLRICAYLEVDPQIWTWLPESAQIRVRRLLQGATPEDLKTFSAFDAFAVPDLAQVLLDRFDALDETTQIGIITEHPKREFVDRAIAIYAEARSYRGAESLGQGLVAPLAQYFDAADIQVLLEVVAKNDQIWCAGGTPDILGLVFDRTRPLLADTRDNWSAFLDEMTKHQGGDENDYYAYPGLRAKLNAGDGTIGKTK